MRVAVLANLKKNAPRLPGMTADYWDELDSDKTIQSLTSALESNGYEATYLEGDANLVDHLRKLKPDICFNICEGHFGDARESQVPALLEMMRIPYTGSQVLTLALALDKPMTKRVLSYYGLPTPPFQVFEHLYEPLDPKLRFPLFVKPSREGTGKGVMVSSIVQTEPELRGQLRRIFEDYDQPALVERYIEGRDVTIGLVGNLVVASAQRMTGPNGSADVGSNGCRGVHLFPPLEVDLHKYPAEEGNIYSNRLKVALADTFYYSCPASLEGRQLKQLNDLTVAVFRVLGCLDVSRVDFRLDANDNFQPYVLEVNPLPGLTPAYSDLCIEAEAGGWAYERLINTILDEALKRYGML
jgi:D-alanine-D-alanine ligase